MDWSINSSPFIMPNKICKYSLTTHLPFLLCSLVYQISTWCKPFPYYRTLHLTCTRIPIPFLNIVPQIPYTSIMWDIIIHNDNNLNNALISVKQNTHVVSLFIGLFELCEKSSARGIISNQLLHIPVTIYDIQNIYNFILF